MATTSSGAAKVTLPADDEILITREFAAPRHLLYRAWTTPDLVKRWWSGHQGEVTSAEIDLWVGGRWRYVMVANGGYEVAFNGEFREIVPNERIVHTEVFEGAAEPEGEPAVTTVTFTDAGEGTIITMLTRTPSKEVRDAIIESGMEVGMQEQLDLLEELARSLR